MALWKKRMKNIKITNPENNNFNLNEQSNFGQGCEITFNHTPTNKLSINNTITIDNDCRFRHFRILIRGHNNSIHIKRNTLYIGTIMVEGSNLNVKIGENCTINGLFITCRDEDILIGDNCLISSNVKIRSSDSHKIFDLETGSLINKPKTPVIIEDHVWIGQDAYIGKNSLISEGSIVAARATVTKAITQKNCVIAEFSKIIKTNIRWEK
jgi:acetyltransferase-like isoleucine patch superfamily enzyme